MTLKKPKDWTFLFVPTEDIAEAMHLGAVRIEGDARLAVPSPLPTGVTLSAFDRWRTDEARFKWCLELVTNVLGESAMRMKKEARILANARKARDEGRPDNRDGMVPIWDFLTALGRGSAPKDRIYLYVTPEEVDELRGIDGVSWDRRRRLYYAVKGADLNKLFKFLTPSAQQAWSASKVGTRATDFLVQEMALAEVERRKKAGSGGGGGGFQTSKEADADHRAAHSKGGEDIGR